MVEVKDGLGERAPVHWLRDLAVVLKNAFFFRGENNQDLHPVLGNYPILKMNDEVFSLIAHARKHSIKVSKGQRVKVGEAIAQVGHSGNPTAPHLHFQLMDRAELLQAKGLPCCFESYQEYKQGVWHSVVNGIPGRRVQIKVE